MSLRINRIKENIQYPLRNELNNLEAPFDFDGTFGRDSWFKKLYDFPLTDEYSLPIKASKRIINRAKDNKNNNISDKFALEKVFLIYSVFESFEKHIQEMSIAFRDHLLHQFQVFLLGLVILNYYYKSEKSNDFIKELPYLWFLTAMFHDIGYPVQHLPKVTQEYLSKLLSCNEDELHILKIINENNHLNERLAEIYEYILPIFSNNEKNLQKDIYEMIQTKTFSPKSKYQSVHSIVSTLYLWECLRDKIIDESNETRNNLSEALAAVLLHDKPIWYETEELYKLHLKELTQSFKNIQLKEKTNFYKFTPVLGGCWNYKLAYREKPLQTLLLICDVLQQWGRSLKGNDEIKYDIIKIDLEGNPIEFILEAEPSSSSSHIEYMCLKVKKFVRDLEGLKQLIESPIIDFKCLYNDGQCNGKCWNTIVNKDVNKFTIRITLLFNNKRRKQ